MSTDQGAVLVHKDRPQDNFVIIPNGTVRDATISYLARGLLADMLSRPPGWRFTAEDMSRSAPGAGLRAVTSAFRELRTAGYLHRVVLSEGRGKLRPDLQVYMLLVACHTRGCQDCPAVDHADLRRRINQGKGPVSAGRIDGAVIAGHRPTGHSKDNNPKKAEEREWSSSSVTSGAATVPGNTQTFGPERPNEAAAQRQDPQRRAAELIVAAYLAEIFGCMSDDPDESEYGPYTGDVVAYETSRDVEVVAWQQRTFRSYLHKDVAAFARYMLRCYRVKPDLMVELAGIKFDDGC